MGIYLVVEANNGLILMWDRKTSLFIKLSPKYKVNLQYLNEHFSFNKTSIDLFTQQKTSFVLIFELNNIISRALFFRVGCVGCVATMTTMQIMTSLQGAMLRWSILWCLGTAGRIHQAALMLRASPAPAQPTHIDTHGPRKSAASYKVMSSLPATPL